MEQLLEIPRRSIDGRTSKQPASGGREEVGLQNDSIAIRNRLMLYRYFKANEFSDLDITCNDQIYRVHKLVLCTRSQFFANAIKFPGKVRAVHPKSTKITTSYQNNRNTNKEESIYQKTKQP
jgi:hypothetical protein